MANVPPVEFESLLLGDKFSVELSTAQWLEILTWFNIAKRSEGQIFMPPSLDLVSDQVWEKITTPASRAALSAAYHQAMEESNPLVQMGVVKPQFNIEDLNL